MGKEQRVPVRSVQSTHGEHLKYVFISTANSWVVPTREEVFGLGQVLGAARSGCLYKSVLLSPSPKRVHLLLKTVQAARCSCPPASKREVEVGWWCGCTAPSPARAAERQQGSASSSGLAAGGGDGFSSNVISVTAPDRLRGSGVSSSSDHLPTLRTPLATLGAFLQGLWS